MEKKRGIDSFTLHILAMLFMLCDHLWATLFPAQEWMTCVALIVKVVVSKNLYSCFDRLSDIVLYLT